MTSRTAPGAGRRLRHPAEALLPREPAPGARVLGTEDAVTLAWPGPG